MLSCVVSLALGFALQPAINTPVAPHRSCAPVASLLTRRELAFSAAAAAVAVARPALAVDVSKGGLDAVDIPTLTGKARALIRFTVTAAASGVPSEARVGRVNRKKEQVLLPLLSLMEAAAPSLDQQKAEDVIKRLKGHYAELDEAVAKGQFEDFQEG